MTSDRMDPQPLDLSSDGHRTGWRSEMSTLRRAGPSDVNALTALARRTWREMSLVDFAMPYSARDIAAFEAEKSSEAVVRSRLLDPDQATWVIEDDGSLIGYADAGPCSLPHPDVTAADMELNRLYVSRDQQGHGHGGRLMEAALDWMGTRSTGAQWIGVWSGNRKAQRFYAAYGFEVVGAYDFPVGQSIDRDFIMRRSRPQR